MAFTDLKQVVDLRGKTQAKGSYTDNGINSKRRIIIHHSLTTSGDSAAFARYHVGTHGWPGVAYHFVILRDQKGTIEWNHDLGVRSYHVGKFNTESVGICLVGDFRTQTPTDAQVKSLYELVDKLQFQLPNYEITQGHSDLDGYKWKQCPVLDWRKYLADYKAKLEPPKQPKQKVRVNADMSDIPQWARESFEWAVLSQITNGERPHEPATRLEVIALLHRLFQNIEKG